MGTMIETVKTLCALGGTSGWEDEVRDGILELTLPYADAVETDAMGNLFVFKKGAVAPAQPIMVCAHMDEVGVIITGYRERFLRFAFVGGVDRRVVLGKRVFIGPDKIPGVIGLKAIHLTDAEERSNKVPALEDLYIDIGAESEDEVKALVRLGWRGVFDDTVAEFGKGFIKAKALDDRVGCAAMVELIKQDLPVDVWFVFTVQEEVGARGAMVAAERVKPGLAIILEGTTAADLGGVDKGQEVCFLGRGVVIPFMDRGTIAHRETWQRVTAIADENGIPWQVKEKIAGGTDASSIQRRGIGARVVTMSAPLRNIHSPASMGKISDIELLPRLCRLVLEDVSHGC